MSTLTEEREGDEAQHSPVTLRNAELSNLIKCSRCKLSYAPGKSTSALKLTYCSFLCELGDLGFSIAGLEHMELKAKGTEAEAETPEPVAAS